MLLTPEFMLKAYASGIFPMAESADSPEIHWYDPPVRGVLPLDDGFHIPRSLAKFIRHSPFTIKVDSDFAGTLRGCAEARPDTWINPLIAGLFEMLHQRGHAHSVEAWQDGKLVGGLYGAKIGSVFFGESMFSLAPNASKVCLVELVNRLRKGGFKLCDVQYQNDHLKQFGVIEIPRRAYLQQLTLAIHQPAIF